MHVWHEVHRIKSKSCAHPLPPLDAAYCRYGRRVASTGGGVVGSKGQQSALQQIADHIVDWLSFQRNSNASTHTHADFAAAFLRPVVSTVIVWLPAVSPV